MNRRTIRWGTTPALVASAERAASRVCKEGDLQAYALIMELCRRVQFAHQAAEHYLGQSNEARERAVRVFYGQRQFRSADHIDDDDFGVWLDTLNFQAAFCLDSPVD